MKETQQETRTIVKQKPSLGHEVLRSMTGYAVETADFPGGQLSLELRAVNSRFLDLTFRMSEDFRALETNLRTTISEQVKRGKLECRINFTPREDAALPSNLNTTLLAQLQRLSQTTIDAFPNATPLAVHEILRWPGMLGDTAPDPQALQATALKLIHDALAQFNASRAREGDKLKAIILDRVTSIR